jgi:hypothetical protein
MSQYNEHTVAMSTKPPCAVPPTHLEALSDHHTLMGAVEVREVIIIIIISMSLQIRMWTRSAGLKPPQLMNPANRSYLFAPAARTLPRIFRSLSALWFLKLIGVLHL